MENQNQIPDSALSENGLVQPAVSSLEFTPGSLALPQQPNISRPKNPNIIVRLFKRANAILAILLVLTMIGVLVAASTRGKGPEARSTGAQTQYGAQELPLDEFAVDNSGVSFAASSVVINGSLNLNQGLVVSPSLQPSSPEPGQIYFDQSTNQLAYYNGTDFVTLGAETQPVPGVESIGGLAGQVGLAGGLAVVGNQLVNAGVLSLGGQGGAIVLGNGLNMTANTLQNSGVIGLIAGTDISITDDGNGNFTINNVGAGTGTVTSGGGTSGSIPVFTGAQNIEDSIISQSGLTATVGGDLSVTGSLSLGTALSVGNGGTGATSLTANGVIVGNGAGALTSVAAGGAGLCLLSTGGAPTWAACPSGTGDDISVNSTGAVNANFLDTAANGTNAAITWNLNGASTPDDITVSVGNASAAAAGTVTTGVQTFAGAKTFNGQITAGSGIGLGTQTLQGTTAVIDFTNFDVSSAGALTAVGVNAGGGLLQGTGGLTVGSTVTLSSLANGFLEVNGSGVVSVGTINLGADTTGDYIANLGALTGLSTTGNSGEGSTPTLSVLYGSSANTAVQGNTGITVTAGTNLTGGGSITLGSGGSVTLDVASSPTFSGDVIVQGGDLTLGTATGVGSLVVHDGDGETISVTLPDVSASYVLTMPTAVGAANQCLKAQNGTGTLFWDNCTGGAGGGLSGSGTLNQVPKFTPNGTTLGDSSISDNGSLVTLNGNVNLSVQGTTVTVGVGSSRTGSIVLQNSTNNNTVTVQSGVTSSSYALTLPTAVGAANQCLKAQNGTGTLFWDNCLGGSGGGGITSINSQTGPAITINNAVGSGNAITIDDAAADGTTKGIATFDSGNFSDDGSGAINTIQDIDTGAAPSFAGLTLTGNLNLGANTLQGTTAVINFNNFDVASNGDTTVGGTFGVTGLTTLNGNLTIQAGDTFTFNSDAFTDLTGNGLQVSSGSLTLALQANKGLEVDGSGLSFIDCTDGQILKYNASNQWVCAADNGTGAAPTLQEVYDNDANGSDAVVTLTSADGAILIRDNATPLGGTLLAVQDDTGTTDYLEVTASGVSLSDDLTVGGTTTLSALANGFLEVNGSGVVSVGTINLGTDTTGDYVANLGALTGLSTSGNSGEGSTPTLSVLYGSSANTAVQGNTGITVTAGTNLTGGGSITLGSGGSVTLDVASSPTFSGDVIIQGGDLTLGTATAAGSLLFHDGDGETITLALPDVSASYVLTMPTAVGAANQCLKAQNGTGTLFWDNCTGGAGGGLSGSGTLNQIPKFTPNGTTLGDSSLSDNGSLVTVNGNVNLTVQGTTVTVGVGSSRTGSIVLQNSTNNNTVTVESGVTSSSYALTLPTAVGSANQCLKAQNGTGTLFWDGCLGGGGGGGITSINSQTGPAITINNASGSGNAITIDDAAADGATKGIATFNSTNFSDDGSGAINTIQDIDTGAAPSFAGLTLTGNLSLGANTLQGTTAVINFNNFDVASNGDTTIGGTLGVTGLTTLNGNLTIQAGDTFTFNSDAFTDLTGNGLQVSSNALTLALQANKGLEVDGNGLSFIDCTDGQILKYNASNQWACAADNGTGAAPTLQDVYNNDANGSDAVVTLTSADGAILIRDNATPLGGTLLAVQDDTGTTDYLEVTASGVTLSDDLTVGGTVTFSGLASGFLEVDGSGVVSVGTINLGADTTGDYVANLGSLTGLTTSGNSGEGSTPTLSVTYGSGANTAVQGNTTLTCPSGTGNLTGGGTSITLGTGGACASLNTINNPTFSTSVTTPTVQNAGLTLSATGANSLQLQTNGSTRLTIASGGDLTATGSATLQGGTVTLGASAQAGTLTLFDGGSGVAAHTGSLQVISTLGQDTTYTLPDPGGASATICLSTGNCLGGGGGGANTALSNLSSVAINTTLLPGSAGTVHLGSGTLPFGDIYLAGTSGTPGTNNFRITGASTSGTRVITLPDESGTVCTNASGSTTCQGNFILNQSASNQTGDFRISGSGRANTSFLSPALDVAAAGTLSLGTSTANAVTIGNAANNSPVTINSGTGNIDIGTASQARTINIGTAASGTQTITIGGSAAGNAIAIGASQTGGQVDIGTLMTTGTIWIGGVGAQTGTITLGGGTGTQAVNLAAGAGVKTVAVGSVSGASSLTLQAGSGGIALSGATTVNSGSNLTLADGRYIQSYTGTSDAATITLASTSGTQTNGLIVDRSGAGGTTTNGINITRTNGTLTNGLAFTGTIGTDINRSSGSLSLNGASDITLAAGGSTKATIGANNITLATDIDLLFQGASAFISNSQTEQDSEAFGLNATVTNQDAVAVGESATSAGSRSIALGRLANSANDDGIAIGYQATISANGGIAIGTNTNAGLGSIALGTGATTSASGQMVIGSNSSEITTVVIGSGVTDSTSPAGFTLQGTSGNGTDVAGASVNIAGGQGTGTGNGGNITFQIADPGTTGASLNALATVFTLSGVNGSALLQNTTNSATAFQVQDSGGAGLLTVDTAARSGSGGNLIKIGNSTGTDTALTILQLDAATTDPTSNLAALNGGMFYNSTTHKVSLIENGQVKVICNTTDLGCGTGTVTLQSAYNNGNTINTTNASNIAFNLTDQSTDPNFLVDLQCDTSCTTNGRFAVQDDGSDIFTVLPAAGGITIGDNTLNTPLTLNSGTGTIAIGTGAQARTINFGTGGAVQTITMGSTNSTSALTLQAGTGNLQIQTQGGTLGVGNNSVAQTLQIGNTTGATAVTIDSGTGTIAVGTGAQARTINIGTGGAAQAVTLGSTNGASGTDLQAGTGGIDITTQGTGALNIGNNAVAQTVNIGNGTGATTVSVLCGTGACGFGNNAVAHATTLGSTTGTATTTLQAGTGGIALTSGANITIGTSDTTGTLLILDTKTNSGDPTGVDGAMYYNSSMAMMRCYYDGAWRFCNEPRSLSWGYSFEDDFIHYSDGRSGTNNWQESLTGGSDIYSVDTALTARPGILRIDEGSTASANEFAALLVQADGFGGEPVIVGGGEVVEMAVNLSALSTGTDEYDVRLGLCDEDNGPCTDGVYFEYERTTSTNWSFVTASGASRTRNQSTTAGCSAGGTPVAVAASSWVRLKFVVNSAGSQVDFYINGAFVGCNTANIPTSGATSPFMGIQKESATATARYFDADYYHLRNSFTTQR